MPTKWRATLDDLRREPGKAELVDGELLLMTAAGGRHGYASTAIASSLREYALSHRRGLAFGDNVGQGAPVFAVEIRSPQDYGPRAEARLAAKRADYFAAGTVVVWDVDLEGEPTVRGYARVHGLERVSEWRRGEVANAEPAVPGWTLPVDELFPDAGSQ